MTFILYALNLCNYREKFLFTKENTQYQSQYHVSYGNFLLSLGPGVFATLRGTANGFWGKIELAEIYQITLNLPEYFTTRVLHLSTLCFPSKS